MSLPPIWKVRREVRRVKDQMKVATLYEPTLRILHGKWLANRAQPILGKVVLGKKVAIFILFQPKGVANSIYFSCDHLIAHGYSPVILSNAPLSDSDRAALLERSALLLERPNFGYDFGAYQDGVRLLDRMGLKPDRLILMNDSTWFPLRANDTSIARMEASGEAFIGHLYKTEPRIRRGRDHMESHFLMFDRTALQSDEFKCFWKLYSMTSSRSNTIERGEKGITIAMFEAGFGSQGLVSKISVLERLANEPFAVLKRMLIEASFDLNKFHHATQDLIATATDTAEWRQKVLDHVRDMIQSFVTTLSATFIYFTMTRLDLGFVKKSNDECFHKTRIKVLEMEKSGDIEPLNHDVRAEMKAAVASWTRT